MSGTVDRAVVIGASIAGLLAARALSDTYAEVLVLDRDELPYGAVARRGVPQIRHTHGLLAAGREAIEELLPGITDELVAEGAEAGDVQHRTRFYAGARPFADGVSGLRSVAVSRVLLEWTIRRRVAETPGVVFYDRSSVLDLAFSADRRRVTGLVVCSVDRPGSHRTVEADLVVDASGRTSRTPERLERRGFQPPQEERVRCDIAFVTRRFRRQPGATTGATVVIHAASPETPRSGLLVAQEGDTWIASVSGYHGVRPPTELAEFIEYARTFESTAMAELLETVEPIGDGYAYRFAASVRRRYERLAEFPEGLLVVGDALASLDPTFGQGMSTAALEARGLRGCLREGRAGLAPRFFEQAARHVDTPWQVCVGGMPPAPGDTVRRPLPDRLLAAYLGAVHRAACDDPVLARAILRVIHLAEPPQSLLAAGYAARVLRWRLRRSASPNLERPSRRGSVQHHYPTGIAP